MEILEIKNITEMKISLNEFNSIFDIIDDVKISEFKVQQ